MVLNTTAEKTTTVKGQATFEKQVNIDESASLYAKTILVNTLGNFDSWNGAVGGKVVDNSELDMYYNNVTIHGDLEIMGQINQSATEVKELYVEDKSIVLGASSESKVVENSDGSFDYVGSNFITPELDMSDSGITVSGVPGMFDTEEAKAAQSNNYLWEKSLMWRIPGLNNDKGTSNLAQYSKNDELKHLEPFWEFKGGQLRLTSHTANAKNSFVSFAFRINSLEQLELVKLVGPSGPGDDASDFKTIAKFGNVVAQ